MSPVIMLSGGLAPPDAFAGLKGWWRADTGVYKDAGTTLAVDADTVQQWNDQSGGGFNLSQGTAADRPVFKTGIVNGQSVIRFVSSDYFEGTAMTNLFAAAAGTMFVVLYHESGASSNYVSTGVNGNIHMFSDTTGANLNCGNNDGAADTAVDTDLTTQTWTIGLWGHDSGNVIGSVSDAREASIVKVASGDTVTFGGNMFVGASFVPSNFLVGDIAEIVIYNVALVETDRKSVETWLANKYGIALPY